MTAPVMMGIASPTGSHLPVLEAVLATLEPGALIIEHGAGLYSTPLFARTDLRIVCAEPHLGWSEWARWIYQGRATVEASFKRLVPLLTEAALVFVDGPAAERGLLIQACLDRRVPNIVAHDTEERDWHAYGYKPHHFSATGYSITQHSEDSHRTTRWLLRS